MGFPWKSYMDGRTQDREIRKFTDFGADNFALSAYGGMSQAAAQSQEYTWGAAYFKYEDFDTSSIAVPRGVTVDVPNSRMAVDVQGVYLITTGFSMTNDERNNGRTFDFRLYNETDDTPGPSVVVGIGRNTPATSFSISFLLDVTATLTGKFWILQVGNASPQAVTANFNTFIWTISSVGLAQPQS